MSNYNPFQDYDDNQDDDFNLEDIFSELNDVLNNSSEKSSSTSRETHHDHNEDMSTFMGQFNYEARNRKGGEEDEDVVWDKKELFKQKILPLLEQMREICKEEDMDFFFSVKTTERENGYDLTNGGHITEDLGSDLDHNKKINPVCELMAMKMLLQLPHEFSHEVIKVALASQAAMEFMKDFSDFMNNKRKGKGLDED